MFCGPVAFAAALQLDTCSPNFLIQEKDGVGILVIMIIMMLVFVGQFGDNNNNNGDDNDDDADNNDDNDDIRWSACVIRHPSIA